MKVIDVLHDRRNFAILERLGFQRMSAALWAAERILNQIPRVA